MVDDEGDMVRAAARLALAAALACGLSSCGDPTGPALNLSDVAGPPPARDVSCSVREAAGDDAAGGNAPRTWRVQRGDTLASIARRVYGRTDLWREIARANPRLPASGQISIGMVLLLPDDVR